MKKQLVMLGSIAAVIGVLSGCATDGAVYRSDVYNASQVNRAQEVKTVNIIRIIPARVAVSNRDSRKDAQVAGMVLGAIAGAAIGNHRHHDTEGRVLGGLAGGALGGMAGTAIGGPREELVEAVQITFQVGHKTYNSTQVGRLCEFKTGAAIMVSSHINETRIQPNNPYGCSR